MKFSNISIYQLQASPSPQPSPLLVIINSHLYLFLFTVSPLFPTSTEQTQLSQNRLANDVRLLQSSLLLRMREWLQQNISNHGFLQDDAKRAPESTCYPLLSSLQCDPSRQTTMNEKDHPGADFFPLNWNVGSSKLSPDPKWWLQFHPNFQHSGYSCDQQSLFEQGVDEIRRKNVVPSSVTTRGLQQCTYTNMDLYRNTTSHLESNLMVSTTSLNHDPEAKLKQLKSKGGFGEYCEGCVLMDWMSDERLISRSTETDCLNLESSWIRVEKTEPWWHVAHEDDLASLVMQKSLYQIENCDLPPPQKHFVRRNPFPCDENISFENCKRCGQKVSVSRSIVGHNWSFLGVIQSTSEDSENSHRYSNNSTTTKNPQEKTCGTDNDPTNSQLLEALRHSQTRAREAEIAAKKSNDEKEHIIKLFLRQTSHLFAYKQWLQLLQLENLYFQLKMKDHQLSTLFPVFSSSIVKENQFKGVQRKGKKQQGCHICRSIFAFVIGFGLAGAGLLLGWTLGSLFPG